MDDEPLDEFYRPAGATSRPRSKNTQPLDAEDFRGGAAGPRDPDDDTEEQPFLRSRRRVAVRQSILPRTRLGRIALGCGVVLGIAAIIVLAIAIRNFLDHDPRFRIDSASNIQIVGNSEVTRPELLAVFGSDIGRNLFFIPLATRRAGLERLPWVEHATIMRLLPNQLRIAVIERVPIAFVRVGNQIDLLDHDGVVLSMPASAMAAHHYSFPVVSGIAPGDPLSAREPRMRLYQRFLADLDSSGERISEQLSEVDISDPEDVKALMPAQGSDLLLHFGDQDFLARFRAYQAHRDEWRQQYPHLASIDLRDAPQVVLGMQKGYSDTAAAPDATAPDAPSPAATAKPATPHPAASAGKPAAPKSAPPVNTASTVNAASSVKAAAPQKTTVAQRSAPPKYVPAPRPAAVKAAINAARLRQQRAHAAAHAVHHPATRQVQP